MPAGNSIACSRAVNSASIADDDAARPQQACDERRDLCGLTPARLGIAGPQVGWMRGNRRAPIRVRACGSVSRTSPMIRKRAGGMQSG